MDFGTANVDPVKLRALKEYRQAKADGRNVKFEDFLPTTDAVADPSLPLPLLLGAGGALVVVGAGAVFTGIIELPSF